MLSSGAGLLCGHVDAHSFVVIDPRAASALVQVADTRLVHRQLVRYELIEFAVVTLAARTHDLVPLHAGCVAARGRGILLIGSSGSGKSTLALHAALSGLDFLAEDSVFVQSAALRATGLGAFVHAREDALGLIDDPGVRQAIRRTPRIRRRSGVRKHEIDLRRGLALLAPEPVRIVATVVLSARRARGTPGLVNPDGSATQTCIARGTGLRGGSTGLARVRTEPVARRRIQTRSRFTGGGCGRVAGTAASESGMRAWLPILALGALLGGCAKNAGPPSDARDVIELRWLQGYADESQSKVETGLLWGLSLLGAQLPDGEHVIRWHGDRLTLDLARAHLVEGTAPAWRQLIAAMKASGEYQAHGALDVGRFMALTLGSPNHYFALTGARANYTTARERYRFDPWSAAIVNSGVALGSRRIDIAFADRAEQIAFVAFEGSGSFPDKTFVPHEMELVDVMPNGQLRFALYGLDGRLKSSASPALTKAGKPAKCMWCHESGLMITLVDYPPVDGFYGRQEFDALIAKRRDLLREYRDRLDTQIEYRNRQDHTFAELLYLAFEEPSRERLAREWGVTPERAAELLRGKPTHAHAEFAFLGTELYDREDVESLAPYAVLAGPQSVREFSAREPAIIEAGS